MSLTNIYIGADHTLSYTGARDESNSYLNTGTATWVLRDKNLTQVATGSLSYQAASSGNYKGTIDGPTITANLTPGETYYLDITFSQSGLDDFRRLPCRAVYRELT